MVSAALSPEPKRGRARLRGNGCDEGVMGGVAGIGSGSTVVVWTNWWTCRSLSGVASWGNSYYEWG